VQQHFSVADIFPGLISGLVGVAYRIVLIDELQDIVAGLGGIPVLVTVLAILAARYKCLHGTAFIGSAVIQDGRIKTWVPVLVRKLGIIARGRVLNGFT